MSLNDAANRSDALPAADDSMIEPVIEIEHQEPVDMTAFPDYQEPCGDTEPTANSNEAGMADGDRYGKEGVEGSFTKGASDAAAGPELACGSDSAIEAALQAAK